MTPSIWKKQQVRELLEEGKSLIEAVHEMQDRYMTVSREAGSFLDFY